MDWQEKNWRMISGYMSLFKYSRKISQFIGSCLFEIILFISLPTLAILNEIKQTDTIGIEQSFILWQNENSPESNREITYLRNALYHKFSDWYQRLNHRIFRDSMSDLFLDMEKYNQRLQLITLSNPKTVRRSLYLLLRILRNLQNKREIYIQEIAKSGETDPSLAVLIAFLKNYQYLVISSINAGKLIRYFMSTKYWRISPKSDYSFRLVYRREE